MVTRTGSAAEFILTFMARQPERAWRISELLTACEGRWKADNFHETLKRLLAAGRVQKTVGADRSARWSAVTAPAGTSSPTETPPVAPGATEPAGKPADRASTLAGEAGTAAEFVLGLLGTQPDLEWRISEIVEAGGCWTDGGVSTTMKRLLAKGLVRKSVADRQAWWGIAKADAGIAGSTKGAKSAPTPVMASVPELAAVPEPIAELSFVAAESDRTAATATQFVAALLASKPAREWRIAEIVAAGGQKWTEPNVYKSLVRLLRAGKLKKTITGRTSWWSAATATATTTMPNAVVPSAPTARATPIAPATGQQLVKPAERSAGSAGRFILDLLAWHPDYEMQVSDIWDESERKWARQTIANTVDRLVAAGKIARVKDGGQVWYSNAGK